MAQSVTTPFRADPADELPVRVQLAWRLRALIASAAGPRRADASVRAMAEWAAVNVNTVRAVYARLTDDGLVVTRHGRGSFVAERAGGSSEVERIAAEGDRGRPRRRRRPARRRDHRPGLGGTAGGARRGSARRSRRAARPRRDRDRALARRLLARCRRGRRAARAATANRAPRGRAGGLRPRPGRPGLPRRGA